jgi:outer membrane protein assembly factor BamB/tetratricopeptide (TPR) repeat protein
VGSGRSKGATSLDRRSAVAEGPAPRALALGLLALGVTVLGPLASPVAAQQKKERSEIHYPASAELGALLRTADKARLKGDYKEAVTLYRSVLDQDEKQLTDHPESRAGEPRRLIGVTAWALKSLRALPAEGRAAFRSAFDYQAANKIDKALRSPDPYMALARTYELYPVATHAPKILNVMAQHALERGELSRARKVLKRLLRHHKAELGDPASVHKKLLLCAIGLGDPKAVRQQALALRSSGSDQIHLDRAPVSVNSLIAQALQREAERSGRYRGSSPSAPHARGDPANRAAYQGQPAFGRVLLPPQEFVSSPRWRPQRLRPGRLRSKNFPARNLAVVYKGLVFTSSADSLHAFNLITGRPERRRLRRPDRMRASDDNEKVQFGPSVGQGILVASFVETMQHDQSFRGIPIKVKIPTRKLSAFDIDGWRWSWDHARTLRKTPYAEWSFPTTPTVHEGRVYAASWSIEGYVNANVAAFDLRTGKPIWGTLSASGQVEQTMFGEQATEPLCVPLAIHDGVVYQPTSLGCVAALDADTGRPLWVTEYDSIEVRPPRGYYADHRNIDWENNAPVVESGVLIVTPLDSRAFYGFDLATGKRIWKARQRLGRRGSEAEMRYVIGAANGRIVLGGGHDVRCVDVRTGLLRWRAPLSGRTVAGRGCIVGNTACVPLDDGSVVTHDLATGKSRGRLRLSIPGNLLLCGRAVVVSGNGVVAVHKNGTTGPGRDFK